MAKIARFLDSGTARTAINQGDGWQLLEGNLYGSYRTGAKVALPDQLLSPVEPTAVYCIGLNYRAHAAEVGAKIPTHPVLFIKTANTVIGHGDQVERPDRAGSTKLDYECELAVVIGKECKNVPAEQALDYVAGYTCANDISARDWQMEWGGGQFCRGKSFDTFCPLGPVLVTADEISDPNTLDISTRVNGERVQHSNTEDMIFDVPALIAFLSASTTLHPGTVLITGTPSGVGAGRNPPLWLQPGDTVSVEIENIGTLVNPVVAEAC